MEHRAFSLEVSELNPAQVTRHPELSPSSDCSVARVKRTDGLGPSQVAVRTPTREVQGTAEKNTGVKRKHLC